MENDELNGEGIQTLPDGQKFEGEWKKGKKHLPSFLSALSNQGVDGVEIALNCLWHEPTEISNDDLRKTCYEDAQIPFLPSFCLKLDTNLLFFTVGFLTAWLWVVKIKLDGIATAVNSSDNFFDEKNFLENKEIKIKMLVHDPVLLIIARVLTLYGMDVRFVSSNSTGKQHLCFKLRNIQNLLTHIMILESIY